MPGKRAIEGGTFLTPRALYRSNITSVDPSVEDLGVPILDTSKAPGYAVGLGQSDFAQYGHNAQLDLAVIIDGFTSVTLEAWLFAEIEQREFNPEPSSSSSSSSSSMPATGEWVFVVDKTLSKSSLWVLRDIPPGKYKVRVSAVSGSGAIHIRENHAA